MSKCLEKRNRVSRGVIKTGGGKRAVPCYVGHDCACSGNQTTNKGNCVIALEDRAKITVYRNQFRNSKKKMQKYLTPTK